VFDLGAHQSVFAMLLVDEVVPAGRVVAVEASDHNYKVGLENLRLNGKSQVELLHALVGDKEGVETISSTLNVVHSTDRGEGFGGSQVRAVTIDGLVKQYGRPDLIFMDIEGFEFVALQSKPTALQLGVSWVIELHGDDMLEPHGGSNQAFAQLFLETGYTIQLIDSGGRITTLQTIQDLPPSRCHILAIPTKPLAH
jgi:FkbM family methyltransferase